MMDGLICGSAKFMALSAFAIAAADFLSLIVAFKLLQRLKIKFLVNLSEKQ